MTSNWQVYNLPGIGTLRLEPDVAAAGVGRDYLNQILAVEGLLLVQLSLS